MDEKSILKSAEQGMDKAVDYLTKELRGIRTGRASTALIEYLKVDYYGSSTDLRDLAAISVPEPTQLLVKPFDPSSKSSIVKTIESSDLGLNPTVDGDTVRIAVPSPSAERRNQLATQAKKMGEDSKVAIRNERRDAQKQIDSLVKDKNSTMSEDQGKAAKSNIDDATKGRVAQIDQIVSKKVDEITSI
ncbi:MAG: ribosome recycling factor [Phycisphaerae bacterium]|nr:ribosome recycling factor [Phycisphaerae bacterium]|tara:strand:+ start:337 stop:903 length:567 start_codon:yes stop_codon:yes gene_type:complete